MNSHLDDNAHQLGIDLLFIFLWIGAWGSVEMIIEYFLPMKKYQFMAYTSLFIIAFISFLFVHPPGTKN
jgi:hypothetical protein